MVHLHQKTRWHERSKLPSSWHVMKLKHPAELYGFNWITTILAMSQSLHVLSFHASFLLCWCFFQIKQRISQLRGEVVKDACALILGHAGFCLSLALLVKDIKTCVKFLLHNGRHVFGDVNKVCIVSFPTALRTPVNSSPVWTSIFECDPWSLGDNSSMVATP